MNPTIFAELRKVLARLFPDEADIRRISDDVGLYVGRIHFGSSALNVWHSVLTEAEKTHKVEVLLKVVKYEYGSNLEFQAVYQAYRQSLGEQEDVEQHTNVFTHQSKPHASTWQQRLPAMLIGIALIGLAGGSAYWMLGGSQSGGNIPPTSTAAVSGLGGSTAAELTTPTLATGLPSSTSIAIVATTAVPTLITSTPQPTNTPSEVDSALCSFAFLVLDEQSEEPVRRATIAVFVGVRQDTGTTDSTGYYLAHLLCSNEQDVEAQVRISADGYSTYNRSVFLSNETTEILLERKAMLAQTTILTLTASVTSIETTTLQLTATKIPTLTPTLSPCTATLVSSTGATKISLRERPTGIATSASVPVGEILLIVGAYDNESAYQVKYIDNEKNVFQGWLPVENLKFLAGCPN